MRKLDDYELFCLEWVGIGWAAHLHYGRGPGLQLPLRWVAASFGYTGYL
jgi:hypothetical protein